MTVSIVSSSEVYKINSVCEIKGMIKRSDYLWIEEQNTKDLKIGDWVISICAEGEKRQLDFMEQD